MASAPDKTAGDLLTADKRRAMLISCSVELSSFALNFAAALCANSLTLWTNTLRVGLDSLACLFAFFVIRRVANARSERFDYGLGKWENLSAFFNAMVMTAGLLIIAVKAVQNFQNPHHVVGVTFGIVILLVYTVVNGWLLWRFLRLHKQDPSPVVNAQFVLYRNATAASVISLLTVVTVSMTDNLTADMLIDTVGALLLSGIIVYGITSLVRQSLSALLDEAVEETLQIRITRALAETYDKYRQLHQVRSRRSGAQVFVELFLEFDPDLSVRELAEHSCHIKRTVENLVPNSEAWVIPWEKAEP